MYENFICFYYKHKKQLFFHPILHTIQSEIDNFPQITGSIALRFSEVVERALENAEKAAQKIHDLHEKKHNLWIKNQNEEENNE